MRNTFTFALSLILTVALTTGTALADSSPIILADESAASAEPQLSYAEGAALAGRGCSIWNFLRTPMQLWNERYDALVRQDIDAVMCTYAPDAVVITPGNVAIGRDQIRPAMEGMFGLFGGVPPTMTSITLHKHVLMVTFFLYAPFVSVPDGSDTYVIRNGYIRYQTVHDTLIFNNPGTPSPLAVGAPD